MKTVKTFLELKEALQGEVQNHRTLCGWVKFNDQRMYVRKHWSYDGGFPVYKDESCTDCIGELLGTKEEAVIFEEIDGERKYYENYTDARKSVGVLKFDSPLRLVHPN